MMMIVSILSNSIYDPFVIPDIHTRPLIDLTPLALYYCVHGDCIYQCNHVAAAVTLMLLKDQITVG